LHELRRHQPGHDKPGRQHARALLARRLPSFESNPDTGFISGTEFNTESECRVAEGPPVDA
jgi:hypothetical protein